MNDDFLRQDLPPVRAEFAHQLKQKLDRQPQASASPAFWERLTELLTMNTRTIKRRVAFALSAGIIAGGALLAASPQVRAATEDLVTRVAGMSFLKMTFAPLAPVVDMQTTTVDTVGAIQIIQVDQISSTGQISMSGQAIGAVILITPTQTTHEAARQQGVKFPSALPAGYSPAEASSLNRGEPGSSQFTLSWRKGTHNQLELMRFTGADSDMSFMMQDDNVKEVKLKNRTVAVVTFAATQGAPGDGPITWQQGKLTTSSDASAANKAVPSNYTVQWKEGDSLYMLSNPSNDLSLDELLAVADSVQ